MTVLGEAWVAIHGKTEGFGHDVSSGVDRELADVDKAGTKHGKRFGDAFGAAASGDAKGALTNLIPEAAIATAVVGSVAALGKLGSTFDEVSDNLRVKTGATGAKLDGLNATFRAVATQVPDSLKETGGAVADLAQKLDLTGKPLEDLSVKFLNLAHITHGDVNAQMDAAIGTFRNFSVATQDQSGALDMLFRASQQSGIGFDVLSSQLQQFGPQLRAVGFNLSQSAGLLATLNKAGVDASQVMPAIGKAAATAAKEHKSASAVFAETFAKIRGAKTDVEASSDALAVFGARAGPRLATLIREGKLSYEDMVKSITGGKDTINKATADTEHFGEKWDKFKNKILVGLEPIATAVFDAMGKGMDMLGNAVGPVVDGINSLGDSFSKLFDSVGGPMAAIQTAWGSLIDGFTGGSKTANSEVGGLAQTFAKIGYAIQSTIAFMSALWTQHAAQIKQILSQLAATFQSEFTAISTVIKVVVAIITDLWDRFGNTLLGKIKVAFDAILEIIRGGLEIIKGVFDLVTAILTGKWGKAWDAIKEIVDGVWKAVIGIVRLGIDEIAAMFEAGKALISAAWSAIWHGIATLVTDTVIDPAKRGFDNLVSFITGLPARIASAAVGMFDGIKDAFKGAINWIIGKWNDLQLKIGGQHIGLPFGLGFDIPTITLNTPNIPMLAAGAIVSSPTLAVVGEAGPEAVVPLSQAGGALAGLLGSIPAGWTVADYVTNLVKAVQIALQSSEGLLVDWADRLGRTLLSAFTQIGAAVDAMKLDTVDKALGDLSSAASSAASAIESAAQQVQQAAAQAAQMAAQQGQQPTSGGGGAASTTSTGTNVVGPGDIIWGPTGPLPVGTTYDEGGWLMPGTTVASNLTGQPERILTAEQYTGLSGGSARPIVISQRNEFHGTTEALAKYVDEANGRLVQALAAEIAAGATPGAM